MLDSPEVEEVSNLMVDLIIFYYCFVSRVMGGDPDTQSITRYIKAFLTKVQALESCRSAINKKEERRERQKRERERREIEKYLERRNRQHDDA